MTQIEELFKLSYKPGISEEKFMYELAAEAFRASCANFDRVKPMQKVYWEIKNGTRKSMPGLKWILDCFYELKRHPAAIRSVGYPEQKQTEMLKAMQDDSLMVLSDQNSVKPISGKDVEDKERSFLHRWPKNRHQKGWSTGDRTFGRFTINADMNPNMIKELDKFCSNHRCVYKTSYPSCWGERVDPVNVYIHEPITEKLKKEFVGIMQKYIRHSYSNHNHLLDGDVLIPGITCASEWTYDEGIRFIRSLPTKFQKDAFNFAHGKNKAKKIAMSLGQRTSLEEFFKLYKQYKPKFQAHTKTLLTKIPTQNAPTHKIPVKTAPQKTPTPPRQPTTKSPVDKLKPQRFIIGKTGVNGCKYLDAKGNVVITETYHPNCVKRVYANGLIMHMWNNPPSTTYTDASKTGKASTEIIVTEKGRGCTKDITTNGELKRKIEAVRKAGLLVTTLPDTPKRSTTIKGRLMRHSVDHNKNTLTRTKGKVSGA